jgi:beta-1,4-mannosyl-glycoprotein beta-1,4-N-acetylglucosaminyltransferase
MIYDTFSFFDELDLLDIRLNVLNNHVDYFVLVESNETFTGIKKPLYYKENQEKFKKWSNKIIYYEIPEYPKDQCLYQKALNSPNTGNKDHWWMREFYQKESLIYPLSGCSDDDIIFVSDVDEIWNPKIKINIEENKVYRCMQTARPFYLNNKSNQIPNDWTGTRVGYYKTLKKYGPNHFRTEREISGIPILDGGWHFSWLSRKQNKWEDNHPDNSHRYFKAMSYKIEKDEKELPEYIIENKMKYKHLFSD